jgi:hypothetical protein
VATRLSLSFFIMPPSTSSSTIIDDRDASVTFNGTWIVGGSSKEHDGTVSSSQKAGDKFSVPFTGMCLIYPSFFK